MRRRSELPRTSKLSRPSSSWKATRLAPIAKGTSVSEAHLQAMFHIIFVLDNAENGSLDQILDGQAGI